MSNNTSNIDLVSKEDLENLNKLDESLRALHKTFGNMVKVAVELSY